MQAHPSVQGRIRTIRGLPIDVRIRFGDGLLLALDFRGASSALDRALP
jgi:hypothetical protein